MHPSLLTVLRGFIEGFQWVCGPVPGKLTKYFSKRMWAGRSVAYRIMSKLLR